MKYLIDAGHGGVLLGHYLTKGKRSPSVPPGIYEGDFNRRVAEWICLMMDDAIPLNLGPIDIPLSSRVKTINEVVKRGEDVCSVSIHANAAGKAGWSSASGFRVFYPYAVFNKERRRKSKLLAECISGAMRDNPRIPYNEREPKPARFTILAKPKCPAVLTECGFMTNLDDAEYLASDDGQYEIAMSHIVGFRRYEEVVG